MSLVIADRIYETTASLGPADFVLDGRVVTYQAVGGKCVAGDQIYLTIAQQHRTTGVTPDEWVTGLFESDGATGLTLVEVYDSSDAGAAVTFSAGTKDVFNAIPAERIVYLTAGGTFAPSIVTPDQVLIGNDTFPGSLGGNDAVPLVIYNEKDLGGSSYASINVGAKAVAANSYTGADFTFYYVPFGSSDPQPLYGMGAEITDESLTSAADFFFYDSVNSLYKIYMETGSGVIYFGSFAITADATLVVDGANDLVTVAGKINTPNNAKTIAAGAITTTSGLCIVDTEAAAASDDLDTINGGVDGMILVIRAANSARTVVAKDGTGNMKLAGDFSLDNAEDTLIMISDATNWYELSRSDNGA